MLLCDNNFRSGAEFGARLEKHTVKWLRSTVGEKYAVVREKHGNDVTMIDRLTGEKIRLEVKASLPNSDGAFRACIQRENHTTKAAYDFVVFWILSGGIELIAFIIPASVLSVKCLTISNPAKGKYSQYRGKIAW